MTDPEHPHGALADGWMATTDRLRLRLLRPRVLAKIGMRLVDSYVDEDGQREIYRRQ